METLFPHAMKTRGVTVRVAVTFLPEQSDPENGRWFWAYHIRLENEGPQTVQLLTRHWIIMDGRGARNDVRGDGVIGDQPVLKSGQSYDYVSGCPLTTPSGSMRGSFGMIGEDGSAFDAAIPPFQLLGPVGAQ
jgi:ApaG protein